MAWNTKPSSTMRQNSCESWRLASVAPRRFRIGSSRASETTVRTSGTTMSTSSVLPSERSASLTLPAPSFRAARALPPAPNHMANAPMSIMSGRATVVAAMPFCPTAWPTKNVSMMV